VVGRELAKGRAPRCLLAKGAQTVVGRELAKGRAPRCLPSWALNWRSSPSYHVSSSSQKTASRLPTHSSAPSPPSSAATVAAASPASLLRGVLQHVAGLPFAGVPLGVLEPPAGGASAAEALATLAALITGGLAAGEVLVTEAAGEALAAGPPLAALEGASFSLRARLGEGAAASFGVSDREVAGSGVATDDLVKKLMPPRPGVASSVSRHRLGLLRTGEITT
jgi:hypothetical protein